MAIVPVLLAAIALVSQVQAAHGQELEFDTEFPTAELAGAPCPPGFPALYNDEVFGTFWGSSRLTMAQSDQYHTYTFFTYEFTGKTSNGATGVKGTHHVNAAQCTSAAYSYWFHVPAVIGTLHNAQFTSYACGDRFGGGDPMTSISLSCEDGGGGGGGEDGTRLRCYTVQIDHYWYYPDTGEVEYRYSETYTWCEAQA